jgi:hypothetical protein
MVWVSRAAEILCKLPSKPVKALITSTRLLSLLDEANWISALIGLFVGFTVIDFKGKILRF